MQAFSLIDVMLALGVFLLSAGAATGLCRQTEAANALSHQQTAFENIFRHTLALPPEQLGQAGQQTFDRFGLAIDGERQEACFNLSWQPVEAHGVPSVKFVLRYPKTSGWASTLCWTRSWRQHARL